MKKHIITLTVLTAITVSAQNTINFSLLLSPSANEKIKTMALELVESGRVKIKVDRIDGHVFASAPSTSDDHDRISITVTSGGRGCRPILSLDATHCGDEWIFAESADFKIGNRVISLKDSHPNRDIFSGGTVYEGMSWMADTRDTQTIIRAILAGQPVLCTLRGSRSDRAATIKQATFSDVIVVYFAMGGDPLKL